MSFYPDFIQIDKNILSKFWYRFYPNFSKYLDKIWMQLKKTLYPNFIHKEPDLIIFESNLCWAIGRSENLGRQLVIKDHLMFCWLCFIKYIPLLCQILKIMFCWSCLCTVSMISAILYDHSVPHLIAKDSNNCDEYCNLSTSLEFHEILWLEHQLLPCIWSRTQWLQIF